MRTTTGRALAAVPMTCACLLTTAFGVSGARTTLASATVKVTTTGPVRTVTPALIGAASAPIFSSTQGFGSGGPATVRLALTAAGTTLSMIQAAFHRASAAQVLSFSPIPALGTTGAPALLGEVLTTGHGPEVLVANLSAQPVTLDVSAILPGALTVTQVTAPSITTKVTGPGSTDTSTSVASGTVQLEPYALADISG